MAGADPIVNKIRDLQSRQITVRTGTTLSGTNRVSGVVSVSLDNDPAGTPVSAVSTAGLLQIGARVVMLAYPPTGLVVIGQIGGVPNLQVYESHDFTNQASFSSVTASLGSPTVGFVFTAPASGSILLDISTTVDVNGPPASGTAQGARARCFGQVRLGAVVGSGSLFWDGDSDKGPLIVFENQRTTGSTQAARGALASGDAPVVGLTPNQVYNASFWYRLETAATGSFIIDTRRITGLLVA